MFRHFSGSFAVIFLRLFAYLPYPIVACFGDMVGKILGLFPSRRRQIIEKNLLLCFPEWSKKKRQQVGAAHFQHAIRSYVERSVQWFGSAKKLNKLITVDSAIDLSDPNLPPTIFLGFHFVGIEAASIFLNYSLQRPCGSLYSRMSSPKINQIARQQRGRFNAEMISRAEKNAGLTIARMLRQRKPVMLGADMDFGISNSIFVPFFGVPACTLTSVSRLAKACQAQVVPFIGEVLPNYRGYRLKVFAPWDNYPTDNVEADTLRMNRFVETLISSMPEQYYWMHRRFKTRPAGEAPIY